MPSEDVTQVWVSEPEAQRFSGLSQETLRMLVKIGEIGGTTMIDKHSLEKYMRDHAYPEQLRLFD